MVRDARLVSLHPAEERGGMKGKNVSRTHENAPPGATPGRQRAPGPSTGNPRRVAVVGAGISGLVAARTLADGGVAVNVYEKSRGTGGRLDSGKQFRSLQKAAHPVPWAP
jgi:NADPH-dependent 2,4-dienoyl-CoA reductase/sulfur reductase-like enzyme